MGRRPKLLMFDVPPDVGTSATLSGYLSPFNRVAPERWFDSAERHHHSPHQSLQTTQMIDQTWTSLTLYR